MGIPVRARVVRATGDELTDIHAVGNSRSAILPVEGPHPRVFFQRAPEGKAVKNRLHLDVRVAQGRKGDERMNALETEANRLEAIGATRASAVLASETGLARNVLSHADGSHGRDEVEEDG